MSVLLVNPPTLAGVEALGLGGKMSYFEHELDSFESHWSKSFPGEHLGLMALVAVLRKADIPVRSVNGQVECHRTVEQTWEAMRLTGHAMDVGMVGFSGPCQVFAENRELALRARREWPNAMIVLGNQFATLNYQRILTEHSEFDVIALGEGEQTIVDLAKADGPPDLASIRGIAWRDENGAVRAQPPPIEPLDLDSLPEIARDELPMALRIGVSPTIFTTRGCPYRCSYCTTGQAAGMLHKKLGYRERSVEPVVDEIERLVVDYRIPHLTIVDDLFVTKATESLARAVDFARTLRARKVQVPFMLDCRLDSADPEAFSALAEAGLYRVFIGIETGSDEQLAFYNKRYGAPYDVEYVRRRVRGLQELGIEVVPGILTFHPMSDPQQLRDTLAVIDACGYESKWHFLGEVFAHPGTTLWDRYRREGWLTSEWPLPAWDLLDPRARHVRDTVASVVAGGGDHYEARNAFARALDEVD